MPKLNKTSLFIKSVIFGLSLTAPIVDALEVSAVDIEENIPAATGFTINDYNGDGKQDVFAIFENESRLFFNSGEGILENSNQLLATPSVIKVASGDIDSDGDIDVITATKNDSHLIWLNDGKGEFTLAFNWINNIDDSVPLEIFLSDIDNDNHLDAIISYADVPLGSSQAGIEIWKNNGSGIFTLSPQSFANEDQYVTDLNDFDGDGKLDILTGRSRSYFWKNDGNGNFSMPYNSYAGNLNRINHKISSADFDKDGDIDFVKMTSEELTFFLNDGTGQFLQGNILKINETNVSLNDFDIADFDNDNDADILIATVYEEELGNPRGHNNYVYLNNGGGGFVQSGTVGHGETSSILSADLNEDGFNDIFLAHKLNTNDDPLLSNSNQVWLNDKNAAFTQNNTFKRIDKNVSRLADFDNDGDLDIFVANPAANHVFLMAADGSFLKTDQELGNLNTLDVAIADIDIDGDQDILAVNEGSNILWLNNGEGSFTQSAQIFPQKNSIKAFFQKVNADEHLDLIVFNESSINIWINDTSGQFFESEFSINGSFNDLAVDDVNGDSFVDIITDNIIYTGNDQGTFDESEIFSTNNELKSIFIADLNNDGIKEISGLLVSKEPNVKINIWSRNEAGNFEFVDDIAFTTYEAENFISGIKFADLNNDDYLDLVFRERATSAYSGLTYEKGWAAFLNRKNFAFTKTDTFLNSNSSSQHIDLVDLDGDNDIDFLATLDPSLKVLWNILPKFTSQPITEATEGFEYVYQVSGIKDSLSDSITFSPSGNLPNWLSFDATTQILSGTPGIIDDGNDTVTLKITDSFNQVVEQEFTITIADNVAPEITSTPVDSAAHAAEYFYQVTVTDDFNTTIEVEGQPAWMNLNQSNLTLGGVPSEADIGEYSLVIRVHDEQQSVEQAFTLKVIENMPPEIVSNPARFAKVERVYKYKIKVSNDSNHTLEIVDIPDWMSFDEEEVMLLGTPPSSNLGETHTVLLQAIDELHTSEQTFTIDIIAQETEEPSSSSGGGSLGVFSLLLMLGLANRRFVKK